MFRSRQIFLRLFDFVFVMIPTSGFIRGKGFNRSRRAVIRSPARSENLAPPLRHSNADPGPRAVYPVNAASATPAAHSVPRVPNFHLDNRVSPAHSVPKTV